MLCMGKVLFVHSKNYYIGKNPLRTTILKSILDNFAWKELLGIVACSALTIFQEFKHLFVIKDVIGCIFLVAWIRNFYGRKDFSRQVDQDIGGRMGRVRGRGVWSQSCSKQIRRKRPRASSGYPHWPQAWAKQINGNLRVQKPKPAFSEMPGSLSTARKIENYVWIGSYIQGDHIKNSYKMVRSSFEVTCSRVLYFEGEFERIRRFIRKSRFF